MAGDRRGARPPTQKELARRLGLSPATVSLALRGSPSVAPQTRRLVREAMETSGYVYNVAAAALRTGRTGIVGVSFHNIAHQFFAEMLIAIEATLADSGRAVFINNHGERAESLTRFVDSLAAYGADGLLVSPPPHATPEMLAPIRDRGAPIVYLSRYIPEDEGADRVVNADRAAMAAAAQRLIALGHRRLALLCGQPGTTVAAERSAGFFSALAAAGLDPDPALWIEARPRLAEGAEAARRALALRPAPTGLVCFNDLVAFGAMNALRSMGLAPGVDVGVVGFGGTDESAAFHPALTTVLDRPDEIGRRAAELLLSRLAAPDAPPQVVTLAPRLVIRESCGGRVGPAPPGVAPAPPGAMR